MKIKRTRHNIQYLKIRNNLLSRSKKLNKDPLYSQPKINKNHDRRISSTQLNCELNQSHKELSGYEKKNRWVFFQQVKKSEKQVQTRSSSSLIKTCLQNPTVK